MALATLDEHALRSTILIAGVHYSWNTGYLAAFESAFLFHKVESIGTINMWLKGSSLESFTVCVRQILTICLAEVGLDEITLEDNIMSLIFKSTGLPRKYGGCRDSY